MEIIGRLGGLAHADDMALFAEKQEDTEKLLE